LLFIFSYWIFKAVRPAWAAQGASTFDQRVALVCPDFDGSAVFPFPFSFSMGIKQKEWAESLLVQPDFFIRVRPGKQNKVVNKLLEAAIPYTLISPMTIALPAATSLENLLDLNLDYVVQDLSSQRVGEFIQPLLPVTIKSVWDCCAASGGKSLLLLDQYPKIELTVSDIRTSILQQLKVRFKQAGISNYQSLVLDLTQQDFPNTATQFDLVIADVPCTGSGTWARTPEQITKQTEVLLNPVFTFFLVITYPKCNCIDSR